MEPATFGGVPGEWVTPRGFDGETGTYALYLHGDSYFFGSVNTHRELVSRIAIASGAKVFSVRYRLAPEHPYPAGLDDAYAAFGGLVNIVGDTRRIVLVGDAAGGGLTTALLVKLRDLGAAMPSGAALICPWVDPSARGGSLETNVDDWGIPEVFPVWSKLHVGDGDGWEERVTLPLVSPGRADLRRLPPLRIDVGDGAMLRDQGVAFAASARGPRAEVDLVVWPEMVHDFPMCAACVPVAGEAIVQIGAFVRERGRVKT